MPPVNRGVGLNVWLAAAAIIVTICLSVLAVLSDLQKATSRHDAEHIGFRADIDSLKQCRFSCPK